MPRGVISENPNPAMETNGVSHPGKLPKHIGGEGPPGDRIRCVAVLSMRHRIACVKGDLVGIETNPGPSARNIRRSERRRMRRRVHRLLRNARRGVDVNDRGRENVNGRVKERVIVTWNVQSMSMNENNRSKLRRVCERAGREGWEVVLLSEVKAVEDGVVWLGEGENRVAIVHSRRAGVLLRGGALNAWVREGQRMWFAKRVVTVELGGLRLVSVYQPIWETDAGEMEEYRRDLGSQIARGGKERLIIGGDFNASVGTDQERRGICGRYGLRHSNEAGRDLIEWCQEHRLGYVNSLRSTLEGKLGII